MTTNAADTSRQTLKSSCPHATMLSMARDPCAVQARQGDETVYEHVEVMRLLRANPAPARHLRATGKVFMMWHG
jgi:hypothetical protein